MAGTCGYGEELSGSINAGNFLTSLLVSFARRTLLHGVSKYNYDSKNIVQGVRVVIHGGLSECEFLCSLEDRNKIHFKNIRVLL